jgi:hypothetical protein
MLTHLLAGLIVSGVTVGNVKLAMPEDESLQDAARLYRIQVYNTFRLDRPEFDRRHEQWVRLSVAWEEADKPKRDLPALLHWLEVATANSRPESIAPLPELPRIVAAHSGRRNGSAWQTILQRLAKDKLKSAEGRLTGAGSVGSHASAEESTTGTKATAVSTSSTLSQGFTEEPSGPSETAPVHGSDATTQVGNSDPTGEASLYQAYGERLGNSLGAFAAGLVRKHAEQNASRNPDETPDSQESSTPND